MATASATIKFSSNYVPYGSNYAVTGKEEFMYTGKPIRFGEPSLWRQPVNLSRV